MTAVILFLSSFFIVGLSLLLIGIKKSRKHLRIAGFILTAIPIVLMLAFLVARLAQEHSAFIFAP
jgi:hypothetical protein